MIVWTRETSRPETGKTQGLAAPLIAVAVGGALVIALSYMGPVEQTVQAAANWVDTSPHAPDILAGILVLAGIVFTGARRLRERRKPRPVLVEVTRTQDGLWEGQRVMRITDPNTAEVRFTLHSHRKAS